MRLQQRKRTRSRPTGRAFCGDARSVYRVGAAAASARWPRDQSSGGGGARGRAGIERLQQSASMPSGCLKYRLDMALVSSRSVSNAGTMYCTSNMTHKHVSHTEAIQL